MPGVTVTAKSATTGFTRTEVTDAEGVYRLNGLPVGTYDLRAELSGFTPYDFKGVIVNLGQSTDINIDLKVAGVAESVSVTAESPLIQTSSSSVGGIVDIAPHREPAAERPSVRQPGGDDPGRHARASTATRPRARSSRRRSAAATAATSTTRSTAATTTTTRSAACCSSSRSRRSRSSSS